jgi:hypothetical protein
MGDENGWSEYEKLVLAELKRANDFQEKQIKINQGFRDDITKLKATSSFWGAIGGLVTGIPALIYYYFKNN